MGNSLRADFVLWSETQQLLYFVGLTVPWEDTADDACKRKTVTVCTESAEVIDQAAPLHSSASLVKFWGIHADYCQC